MISFFRRVLSSWVVLGLLGLVMIAFVVTGVGPGMHGLGGGAGDGDVVAKVGGKPIGAAEITTRARLQIDQLRQQQPGIDMKGFVREGGIDRIIDQFMAARAMELWAKTQGMAVSKRLVDGEIASIAAFRGPTGQFDPAAMRAALAQRRISEQQLRADVGGDALRTQLLIPVAASARAPLGLVTPYAALLLETRQGQIGVVPAAAMPAGTPPNEAEIAGYYQRNIARFSIGERRLIRYAVFGRDRFAATKASEAEIADYYRRNAGTYAARDSRTLSQVILPGEAQAKALVARIRAGTPFAKAAADAGFASADTALGEQPRAAFAKLSSPAVAAAAYAARQDGVTDPVKSELGWHVVHVDAIRSRPAEPIEAVRGDIAKVIEKQKADDAIAAMVNAVEDAISDGSSFDDIVKSEKLTVATTPPLLADGRAPDQPGYAAPAEVPPLLRAAFQTAPEDDPTVETLVPGERYALIGVTAIQPAAPLPFAKVRDAVLAGLLRQRAGNRAKAVATAIAAKANAGTPLDKAFAEAGVRLPAPVPAGGRQADIAQSGRPVPPPLALLFSMAPGKTNLLAAPDGSGWFVVRLASITPGNPASAPGLVDATRNEFARVLGDEYAEQFARSVAKAIGAEKYPAAIAKLKAQLISGGAAQ